MKQKVIGAGIAIVLVSFAAIGAFASQDGVSTQVVLTETPTSEATATATETASATATGTLEPTQTGTPEATATGTPGTNETPTATGTPEATSTPEATGTSEPDDDQREIKGIPTSNPNHHDGDDDGVCDKGETAIKTTPSGVQVRVPCQAAHEGGHGHGAQSQTTPEAGDDADAEND